jgi:putative oxidoreductase
MSIIFKNRAAAHEAKLVASLANDTWLPLFARILLSTIFLWSGVGNAFGYAATARYMANAGVSELLLPLVILVEVGGALMLVAGWQARLAAAGLAMFTLLAALLFHKFWAVPEAQVRMQQIHFTKNLAIVGGLLQVVAFGPGAWSLDRRGRGA